MPRSPLFPPTTTDDLPSPPMRYLTASPLPMNIDDREPSDLDRSPPQNRYHFGHAYYSHSPPRDHGPEYPDMDSTESEEFVLVRTGNASRLRRRGAIRIEPDGHGGVGLGSSYSHGIAARRRMSYGVLDESEEGEPRDGGVPTFDLYCGGPVAQDPSAIQHHPYSHPPSTYVSPLPQPLSDFSRSRSAQHSVPAPSRTNGCGAILHVSAVQSPSRPGNWAAPINGATGEISTLDKIYYEGDEWLGRMPCGCVTEAVGCLSW